ncbi:transposase [Nostoc sp. CHAB 5824]|nr:transposase [Nostoc sp. CHAB 5824]
MLLAIVKNDFVSKGRSVSDLEIHLVLTIKYRLNAFTKVISEQLHIILEKLLVKWDCKLI